MGEKKDLNKLPKWAQTHIRTLEQSNAGLKARLDAGTPPMAMDDDGVGYFRLSQDSTKLFGRIPDVNWIVFNLNGLRVKLMAREGEDQVEMRFEAKDGTREAVLLPRGANAVDISTRKRRNQ